MHSVSSVPWSKRKFVVHKQGAVLKEREPFNTCTLVTSMDFSGDQTFVLSASHRATTCTFRSGVPTLRSVLSVWLAPEHDVNKEWWPVAQPKLTVGLKQDKHTVDIRKEW